MGTDRKKPKKDFFQPFSLKTYAKKELKNN